MRYIAKLRRVFLSAALLSTSLAVVATKDEAREHGAHKHGHGRLNVVTEGTELAIELYMPAVNVVGFEHEPRTDEQKRAVEKVLQVFGQVEKLFVPSPAARCKVENVVIEVGGMAHHEGESHGEHEHEGHDESEKGQEETHSELHARYHFHCDSPKKLVRLEVQLFENLKNAEEIAAQVVTTTVQTATALRPGETSLKLTR